MAGNGAVITRLRGVEEVRRALLGLAPRLRRRALRNALAAGGRVFRDEGRRLAPVLKVTTHSGASALRRGVRKVGTLRKAIRVRTSKLARRAGDVGVFVNVVPAKGGNRGAKNPNDPFYWRFQNFGWKNKPGVHFLEGAATKSGEALRAVEASLGPQVQRFNVSAGR